MPDNNHHTDHRKPKDTPHKPELFAKRKRPNSNTVELVIFENSMASRVNSEDIVRAFSLFRQTQKKIIKSKVTQIYFN
jgi:hypothetical protein